ncbi:hypothetical protein [Cupriavidus sp. H18C1]
MSIVPIMSFIQIAPSMPIVQMMPISPTAPPEARRDWSAPRLAI